MVSSIHLLQEFDLDAFSSAQFQDAITQRRKAEDLSAVLYPNVTWFWDLRGCWPRIQEMSRIKKPYHSKIQRDRQHSCSQFWCAHTVGIRSSCPRSLGCYLRWKRAATSTTILLRECIFAGLSCLTNPFVRLKYAYWGSWRIEVKQTEQMHEEWRLSDMSLHWWTMMNCCLCCPCTRK